MLCPTAISTPGWVRCCLKQPASCLALSGVSPLQSFPSHTLYLENTGSEISFPFIITRVCSVLPWSEVKAIVLETPLYSWSKVKVRVIQIQKYNSYLFPVQGNWKFCRVTRVSHASFGYFPQWKALRWNQVWEFISAGPGSPPQNGQSLLITQMRRMKHKREMICSKQIQGFVHNPFTPR